MKPAILIPFLLVVAAVSAPSAVCFNPAVLDTSGNPVLPDISYYIETTTRGVYVSHTKQSPDTECPQIAVLTNLLSQPGTPVKFYAGGRNYVPESTDISITFSPKLWPCEDDTRVWRVDPNSPSKRPDISTNGYIGGEDSKFKIKKLIADTYKFVYCKTDSSGCTDIGVFSGPDGILHLGPSPNPLFVTFRPQK